MKDATNLITDEEKKENLSNNRDAILKTFLTNSDNINSKNEVY